MQGATGITKIVGEGFVKLPIEDGILVEAYHAPMPSSNILSVALLSDRYEVVLSKSIKIYPACFLMRKKNLRNCHGISSEKWALSYFSTFDYSEILQ